CSCSVIITCIGYCPVLCYCTTASCYNFWLYRPHCCTTRRSFDLNTCSAECCCNICSRSITCNCCCRCESDHRCSVIPGKGYCLCCCSGIITCIGYCPVLCY